MSNVLVTGGTGLVGKHLCGRLQENGHEVAILTRSSRPDSHLTSYRWDPDHNIIDQEAIHRCDCIIHLAGVNIGEKRWTKKRKQEILDSRIRTAELIFDHTNRQNKKLEAFITASAVGYYGAGSSEKIFNETDPPAGDFLGETCRDWERSADRFTGTGVRTVKIRTGIVLSKNGGALSKLIIPIQWGMGAAIGNGKQYMPWIHIDDLCGIYIKAMEDKQMTGAYNAVAPEHITNKEFTKKAAHNLNKPYWFPNIPAGAVKLLYGEMSQMILSGHRISSRKIETTGYKFLFPDLDSALKQLYSK